MENEVWKDILGYEGLYQISNLGVVKSLDRPKLNSSGIYKGVKIKTRINQGYYYVGLSKNGSFNSTSVHRLIAQAFIPNPENKPCVNHINGNKLDNRLENLEWCTHHENILHAWTLPQVVEQKKIRAFKTRKNIILRQLSKTGQLVAIFKNFTEMEEITGIAPASIRKCLNGKRNHAGGYKWELIK